MANKEERARTSQTRCKQEHLIQHTCIRSMVSSRGYTFEACISGVVQVTRSSTRVYMSTVDELDVFGSWVFGDGSRCRHRASRDTDGVVLGESRRRYLTNQVALGTLPVTTTSQCTVEVVVLRFVTGAWRRCRRERLEMVDAGGCGGARTHQIQCEEDENGRLAWSSHHEPKAGEE
ncbi:hypothetical protein TRIUR3_31733 [Triticum urartu]|uniref:Uncharacterized protein n=1 Tax=Triticum urartu TaxID=4572 RepID=M7Z7L9_TRIUA|nr:hypothetical protein TRIUR3_31733 [Triticum urartu]